ncbi:MAG: chromosomal replication initiator protein DnaA [Bacillota bacterium]|nr:chromosomal replication initiator protein DnaA [Bacillota bacterium]
MSEIALLWEKVLSKVKSKLNDQNIFEAFFANSYVGKIEGQTLYVVVNSGLAATLLETKYIDLIDRSLLDTLGTTFDLKFVTEDEIAKEEPAKTEKPKFFSESRLNPGYTFKSFVVGATNREAYQASILVAKDPGKTFNPLLVYSDSGLGKTHLLHSIGNSLRETYPNMKVLYCTAADFVDEYVKYASGEKEGESLASYFKSNVDVFLVDDIQFLVGKKKTMEMFFVVFSTLYNQGKQIVITSDQHPNDLDGLDQRLRTRFVQGLTLSIRPPDLPTSEGILKARIETNGLDLNDFEPDVIPFISQRFSSNVRELEEALNRLLFYTINIKPTKHIDLAVATEAMQDLIGVQENQTKLSETKIINVVADYYNITPSQITGKIRTSQIAMARHICMYLMRDVMDIPFVKIGQALGGKDHATVISGVQKVEKALKTDAQMQQAISELKARLKK